MWIGWGRGAQPDLPSGWERAWARGRQTLLLAEKGKVLLRVLGCRCSRDGGKRHRCLVRWAGTEFSSARRRDYRGHSIEEWLRRGRQVPRQQFGDAVYVRFFFAGVAHCGIRVPNYPNHSSRRKGSAFRKANKCKAVSPTPSAGIEALAGSNPRCIVLISRSSQE
jgi:hypothetical protein